MSQHVARTGLVALVGLILSLLSSAGDARAATFAPDPIRPSGVIVRAVEVATPFSPGPNNFAAPKAIDGALHYVDQAGRILRETASGFQTVLDLANAAPAGFSPSSRAAILDIADGAGDAVFVATLSESLPTDAPPARRPPTVGEYSSTPLYQVVYRYRRASDGTLTDPVALASFGIGDSGHLGGGLLGLDGGDVLFAIGDGLLFGTDGRAAPQDDSSHLSKILRIDATTGAAQVVAKGLRNTQRLTWTDASKTAVAMSDIGAATAEEINVVPLADLLDTTVIENFGWGRNADGLAREGTFYIAPGAPGVTGAPDAVGEAPPGEAGFLQPYAQFGREDLTFAAVSGPVFSASSFDGIAALFGDLVSGRVYATLADPFWVVGQVDVFRVNLQDESGAPTSLFELGARNGRVDPRFFNFADGGAGVLLEGAGRAFRLTEVRTAVPLPAMGWAFALLLAGMAMGSRGRSGCRGIEEDRA
ncbi:hypothetical protein [Jannaschia seohaensis]|uniref:Glucose/Sorbosone dehydrogenase domain-containing protein n=1 Tax=Jannaschia seohaensis TaxID=475081 RepID=A0A2Y9A1L6_9RHOB|nr:hypothetical protein [Jannaschia seohaensis]PWJ22006.1 hypothetical protein BCF38_101415 [Jannaschia seohaensis]SSA38284.1 hypothetical protein SAMN05421539_101415 [Jannaschia seohaensis]